MKKHFQPGVTVAAVVSRGGRFLFVREHTDQGIRVNQPAGHLDPGESLTQAVERETLEETGWVVQAQAVVGVYLSRYRWPAGDTDVTYLRVAVSCRPVRHDPGRALDQGIIEALWLTPEQLGACRDEHRSPQVEQTLTDHLNGQAYSLDLLHTDPGIFEPPGQ